MIFSPKKFVSGDGNPSRWCLLRAHFLVPNFSEPWQSLHCCFSIGLSSFLPQFLFGPLAGWALAWGRKQTTEFIFFFYFQREKTYIFVIACNFLPFGIVLTDSAGKREKFLSPESSGCRGRPPCPF